MSATGTDLRGAAVYVAASSLTLMGAWLAKWVRDRSAYRRLDEARQVVAQVDQSIRNLTPEMRQTIEQENREWLVRINQSIAIVHNRLEQLEERTQDANVIDAHQVWGPLVVALDQLADEAKSIYDEVLTTSSNAAASNRTGRYRHTGPTVVGTGSVNFTNTSRSPA